MSAVKSEALVIRTVDFSETSRIVTLFTREFGKISALAKGARRAKSQFENALELLSVCDIGVIRKPMTELDLLTEAVLKERFAGLRTHLPALYAGYYLAEVLDAVLQRDDRHQSLYDEVIGVLRVLTEGNESTLALGRGIARLVLDLGLAPRLDRCASCHQTPTQERVMIARSAGGLMCPNCASQVNGNLLEMSREGWLLCQRLIDHDDQAWRLVPTKIETRREAIRFWLRTVEEILNRRPKTSAFLILN